MEVVFLGTSAGAPTVRRNMQSCAVRFESGEVVIVDCGEGTQQQLLKLGAGHKLKLAQVTSILVTHLHGDHVFGLPGLMCFLDAGKRPLRIVGPRGTRAFARYALRLSRTELSRPFFVVELVGGPDDDTCDQAPPPHPNERPELGEDRTLGDSGSWDVADEPYAKIDAAPLDHAGMPCVAYRFDETPRLAKLRADVVKAAAEAAGDQVKRVFAVLKRDHRVELKDGSCLEAGDVFVGGAPTRRGRRVVVFGDTRRCALGSPALALADRADLVVHEATFDETLADKAFERGHSTSRDAGRVARDARARTLALWHFSPRYEHAASDDVDTMERRFIDQARHCDADDPFLGDVVVASDLLRLPVAFAEDTER